MISEPGEAAGSTTVTGAVGTAVFTVTATARASVRTNFAIHHLRAAMKAALDSYDVEQSYGAEEFGPGLEDILMLVPVSVSMAGAALEANANELIQDILDGFTALPVTAGRKLLLIDLKEDRSGNSIDKYRRLALLFDVVPSRGTAAWQDAELLVKFRNALMHFKPAWDHETGVHDGSLVKGLRHRIPTHRAYQTSFQFPFGYMTYGCARWSVLGVLAFSAEYSALLGVRDRLAPHFPNLALPQSANPPQPF